MPLIITTPFRTPGPFEGWLLGGFVSSNGTIAGSVDNGQTFSTLTSSLGFTPLTIVYTGILNREWFTAGGNNIAFSSDAVNWTNASSIPSGASRSIKSLSYGNGILVACGTDVSNGFIYFSTDNGSTWTLSTTQPPASNPVQGLATDGTQFVVGTQQTGNNWVAYSTDGDNWTQAAGINIPNSEYAFAYSTAASPSIGWGAVGRGPSGNEFATSSDGQSWTNGSFLGSGGYERLAVNDVGLFMGLRYIPDVGLPSAVCYKTSDFVSWTGVTNIFTVSGINRATSIGWNNGTWLACAKGTGASDLRRSTNDGTSWSTPTHPFTSSGDDLEALAYSTVLPI